MAFTDGSREEGVASSIDVVGHTENEGLCFLGCVAEEDGDHWVGERVEVFVVGFDLRFHVAGAGGMDCDCCVRKAGTVGVYDIVQSVFEFFIEGRNHSGRSEVVRSFWGEFDGAEKRVVVFNVVERFVFLCVGS